jgi:putative iron-dependent peroxidase
VSTAQGGIFALGTASHAYLEFEASGGAGGDLVRAISSLREPRTTIGGVNDAVLWLSGSAYDVIFDVARDAIAELRELASVVEETSSWPYRHDRDSLTHYTRPLTGAYYFVRSTDALRRRFEP